MNHCVSLHILRYFGVDINAIREYAETCNDIQHVRAEIRLVMARLIYIIMVKEIIGFKLCRSKNKERRL